ncbi:MAG TPA: hypothetical protein VJ862_00595, partial [Rhodanobacteraceae bacterium]|nr:hypothetical protein [Rhodanobacteraceae bacterium]
DGTSESAIGILAIVASLMGVPAATLVLETYSERDDGFLDSLPHMSRHTNGTAGHFQLEQRDGRYVIGIEREQLRNPLALVATLAHELGHVILLGGRFMEPSDRDHEFMTDLLTVYFGFGIFTANSAFQFRQWQSAGLMGWSASRTGYLSESMFGYALALYARMRDEAKPTWLTFLNANVRSAFKASQRYIQGAETCAVDVAVS